MAYDKNGLMATDTVPPGSTVTAAYYRKFLQDVMRPKIRQKVLPFSQPVSSFCMITCGLMPQVQYRKFWKSMDGKCFLTRRTVLTWAHQTLICSQNWRDLSVGNVSESLRRCLRGDPSNQTHQKWRRPDRNTRIAQTLDGRNKAQWRLHWRPVNVFCKINSFLKRKHTVCRASEMTHIRTYVSTYIHIYIHTYIIHTYIHTYIHTCIHTYISINVCMHDQSELSYPHSFAMYLAKMRASW